MTCITRWPVICGFTDDPDPGRWKDDNPDMRQRMKTLQLGINYGMGVPSLARGLNRHPLIASGSSSNTGEPIRSFGNGATSR